MRFKDGRNANLTKTSSIPDYKKVWGGNEFKLHVKFANLLNLIKPIKFVMIVLHY